MYKLKYISLFLAVLFTTACSDFLDEELKGTYTSDTYYQTEEDAIGSVNGIYEILAFSDVANNLWVFGDVASDDAIKGGNSGDQTDIKYVDEFNVNPDNGAVENIWKHYFEGINRANNTIHYVPQINMDEVLRNRIVAEGKFLRAYFYFNLVNVFGEIPLKTKPALTPDDLQVALSPVEDIYAQIETDLTEAIDDLPVSYPPAEVGRITKGAALGLLAKAFIYNQKWQNVLDVIAEIENLGLYQLMPLYQNNFELASENNQESIFEIQHLSGQNPFMGNYLNQWFSPQVENGYFFNVPTQDIVNEFEQVAGVSDPRLDYSIGREGGKWLNDEAFDPAWSPTGYLSKKHCQPLEEVSVGTKGDAGLNYIYMRYADILLMKAEALNELGRVNEALEPLNQIRTRARESYLYDENLVGYGSIPENLLSNMTSTNQNELREAIQHERRVELCFEFHRYFDLMRYGKQAAEAALKDQNFNYENNRFFPIPQSELDTNKAI